MVSKVNIIDCVHIKCIRYNIQTIVHLGLYCDTHACIDCVIYTQNVTLTMYKFVHLCNHITIRVFLSNLRQHCFVLGGIRTHNLLILGQTSKPSCLGARQEDSCLPKYLIQKVRWIVCITRALRMTDVHANFKGFFFQI